MAVKVAAPSAGSMRVSFVVVECYSDVGRPSFGSLSLDGETTLAELKEGHDIEFIRSGVTTIAGLLLAGHGTVPAVGAGLVDVKGKGQMPTYLLLGRKAGLEAFPSPGSTSVLEL